jgi:precorrin-2 dehydrogenase/sirohydrochlorin ferrochelatase
LGSFSYPIVLTNLDAAPCLVVGGGIVAERKIAALLEAGARVAVISPTVTAQIQLWADDGRLHVQERVWEADDILGAALVIAATNDRHVNALIAGAAHAARVLVNVVDDPAAGSFITPATIRRGDLLVAVTTGGQSPVVAALVRRTLERTLGDEYTMLLELLGNLRRDLRDAIPRSAQATVLRALATDEMLEWLRTGQHDRVSAFVSEQVVLAQNEQSNGEKGPAPKDRNH